MIDSAKAQNSLLSRTITGATLAMLGRLSQLNAHHQKKQILDDKWVEYVTSDHIEPLFYHFDERYAQLPTSQQRCFLSVFLAELKKVHNFTDLTRYLAMGEDKTDMFFDHLLNILPMEQQVWLVAIPTTFECAQGATSLSKLSHLFASCLSQR